MHYWHSEHQSAKELTVPTYQYACTACGHQLEAVQSFTDEALSVCPECQGRLRKLFSGVGVVFKGSGFYRTDSRASNSASAPAAPTQAKSESKSETKSESKSETKSTAKPAANTSSASS
jgi:putative FmdB family regulatory protein